MTTVRRSLLVGIVGCALVRTGIGAGSEGRVHAQSDRSASLVGAWTLNSDQSDTPRDRSSDGREDRGGDRRGRGQGGGGGFGRRGGGGGFGRGDAGRSDPEQAARMRDAMRDILNPPAHLTIVQTEAMIILTGPDGRTTRLSPDGKKVKDESTKIDRKTRWDGGKLVSEITGQAAGKVTETYSVDPERHQLHVDVQLERRPDPIHRVYDAD
jgi:hypothetical protein